MRPVIQQRIEQYSDKEIRFTLLALVANRLQALREKLSALESDHASDSTELIKLQELVAAEEAKVKRYKVQ